MVSIEWYRPDAFKNITDTMDPVCKEVLANYLVEDEKQPIIIVNTPKKCYRIYANSEKAITGETYKDYDNPTHKTGYIPKVVDGGKVTNVGVIMEYNDNMVCSVTKFNNDPCWARIVSLSFRILY